MTGLEKAPQSLSYVRTIHTCYQRHSILINTFWHKWLDVLICFKDQRIIRNSHSTGLLYSLLAIVAPSERWEMESSRCVYQFMEVWTAEEL